MSMCLGLDDSLLSYLTRPSLPAALGVEWHQPRESANKTTQ